jgi:hypothetical protein
MINNGDNSAVIYDFNGLIAEKKRIEALIEYQKNIIRHDFDELKNQFKKEIKPALDAASFVKQVAKPETRTKTLLLVGSGIVLDLALKRLLGKSNILTQMILPRLIKRYTKRFLSFRSSTAQQLNLKPE